MDNPARTPAGTGGPEATAPFEPYPGLRPFEEDEFRIFFGRGSQVEAVVDRLRKTSFAFVVGGSGSGKSSIINAGVIPRLRLHAIKPGGTDWLTVRFTPGMEPMDNLAGALTGLMKDEARAPSAGAVKRQLLEANSLGSFLDDYHGQIGFDEDQPEAAKRKVNLLIVCDQFEEIFRDENRKNPQSQQLVDLLLEAYRHRQDYPRLYIVVAMRSEDLHRCAAFMDLPDIVNESLYLTRRLNEIELAEALVEPLRLALRRNTPPLRPDRYLPVAEDPWPFHRDVLGRLLIAARSLRHDPDHLPLLQHAAFKLWNQVKAENLVEQAGDNAEKVRITEDHLARALGYENWSAVEADRSYAPGGDAWILSKALDVAANEVLEKLRLNDRLPYITEMMFRLLAELDDNGNYKRRWSNPAEIMSVAGATQEEVDTIVAAFCSPYPFLDRSSLSHSLIHVAHESLLRNWSVLNEWLKSERKIARQFTGAARIYRASQRQRAGDWFLSSQDVANFKDWWEQRGTNSAWGIRYASRLLDEDSAATLAYGAGSSADFYSEVVKLYGRSKKKYEAQQYQRLKLIFWRNFGIVSACSLAVFLGGISFSFWLNQRSSRISNEAIRFVSNYNKDTVPQNYAKDRARAAGAIISLGNVAELIDQREWMFGVPGRVVGWFGREFGQNLTTTMSTVSTPAALIVTSYMRRTETKAKAYVAPKESLCDGDGKQWKVWGPIDPPIATPNKFFIAFTALDVKSPEVYFYSVPMSALGGAMKTCSVLELNPLGPPLRGPPEMTIQADGIDPNLRLLVFKSSDAEKPISLVYQLVWFEDRKKGATSCDTPEMWGSCLDYESFWMADDRGALQVGGNSTLQFQQGDKTLTYAVDSSYRTDLAHPAAKAMIEEAFSDKSAAVSPLCAVMKNYVAIFRETENIVSKVNEPQYIDIYDAYGQKADCKSRTLNELPQVASIPFPDATVTDIVFDPDDHLGSKLFLKREGNPPLYYQVSWNPAGMLASLCETWAALDKEFKDNPNYTKDELLSPQDKSRADAVCLRHFPH